jgi:hypothetical protein
MPSIRVRPTASGIVIVSAPSSIPILPGDQILSIDGYAGPLWERLLGEPNSSVDLLVFRPATGERLRVRLPRDEEVDNDGC